MQVTIRLYRQHDMDLIRMYMNKAIRFTEEVKRALIAYANGKIYTISITDSTPSFQGYLKTSILMHVSIDAKKNPEVITLFSRIKPGQRNAFIKTVTRRSMSELPLSAYFAGDGIIMSRSEANFNEQQEYNRIREQIRQEASSSQSDSKTKTSKPEPVIPDIPEKQVTNEDGGRVPGNKFLAEPIPKLPDPGTKQSNTPTVAKIPEQAGADDVFAMFNALAH